MFDDLCGNWFIACWNSVPKAAVIAGPHHRTKPACNNDIVASNISRLWALRSPRRRGPAVARLAKFKTSIRRMLMKAGLALGVPSIRFRRRRSRQAPSKPPAPPDRRRTCRDAYVAQHPLCRSGPSGPRRQPHEYERPVGS